MDDQTNRWTDSQICADTYVNKTQPAVQYFITERQTDRQIHKDEKKSKTLKKQQQQKRLNRIKNVLKAFNLGMSIPCPAFDVKYFRPHEILMSNE